MNLTSSSQQATQFNRCSVILYFVKPLLLCCGVAGACGIFTWSLWDHDQRGRAVLAGNAPDVNKLMSELGSMQSAIVQLAGERFAANQRRGATWIVTLHDATTSLEVLKYTDGTNTLVALPVLDPQHKAGLRRFADAYNSLTLKSADLKAIAGQFREAGTIYRILLRHDPESSLVGNLRLRLKRIGELEKGQNVSENLEALKSDFIDYAPGFLEGMTDSAAVHVTNLFELQLK